MSNDSFLRGLAALQAVRGGSGESQIQETRKHGPVLNAVTPFLNALFFSAGAGIACGGVAAFLWGLGERAEGWGAVAVVLGPCFAAGFGMLAVNQARELLNTFWRKSPMESLIAPPAARLIDSLANEGHAEPENGGFIRVRSAAELRAMLAGDREDADTLPADAANFVDFLVMARNIGLARAAWLPANGKRVTLPSSGMRVTRQVYETMIDEAADWGFVQRGEGGAAHRWLVEPRDALRTLGEALFGR